MSKKTVFKSKHSTRSIEISRSQLGDVALVMSDQHSRDIVLSATSAPALALAILSAASIVHHDPEDTPYDSTQRTENMGPLNMAAFYLAQHVNQSEKAAHIAAKEAADREALEREAWELWTEFDVALYGEVHANSLNNLTPIARDAALVLASKAREIHKAKS